MPQGLTMAEEQELNALEAQIAQLQSQIKGSSSQSTFEQVLDSLKGFAKELPYVAGEAGMAALGQKAGMALAPVTAGLSIPVLGGAGGLAGYEATQRMKGEEPTMRGRLQAIGMGAIPFAPEARLAGAGATAALRATPREIAKTAGQQAAMVAGVAQAAKAGAGEGLLAPEEAAVALAAGAGGGAAARATGRGVSGVGEKARVASSAEAAEAARLQAQRLERDEALAAWQALGGVNDPVQQTPGLISKSMERAAGGRGAVTNKLKEINNRLTDDLFRSESGLATDSQLNLNTLRERRFQLNAEYKPIASLPGGDTALENLQRARKESSLAWKKWADDQRSGRQSDPDLLKAAKNAQDAMDTAEDAVANLASKHGSPDLYDRLLAARKQQSMIHVGEAALNNAAQTLDSKIIGKIYEESPRLLTGGLRLIGQIANIQPQAMGEFIRETSSSGRGVMSPIVQAGIGGTIGYQAGGLGGAATGAGLGMASNVMQDIAAERALQFMTNPAVSQRGGQLVPNVLNFQRMMGLPQYQTNVPSNLSLFLSRTGASPTLQGAGVEAVRNIGNISYR